MDYTEREGLVFYVGDLKISPITESFRRFTLWENDHEDKVSIKIPGEMKSEGKDKVGEDNFLVPDTMRSIYGRKAYCGESLTVRECELDDPRLYEPLYGKEFDWMEGGDYLPTLVVYKDVDGKRITNSPAEYTKHVSAATGISVDELERRRVVAYASYMIRLHLAGYVYRDSPCGFDYRAENFMMSSRGDFLNVGDTESCIKKKDANVLFVESWVTQNGRVCTKEWYKGECSRALQKNMSLYNSRTRHSNLLMW